MDKKFIEVLFLCQFIRKEKFMNIGIERERQDFLVGEQLVEITKVRPKRSQASAEKILAMIKGFNDRHGSEDIGKR